MPTKAGGRASDVAEPHHIQHPSPFQSAPSWNFSLPLPAPQTVLRGISSERKSLRRFLHWRQRMAQTEIPRKSERGVSQSTALGRCRRGAAHTRRERKAPFGQLADAPLVQTLALASCHTFQTKPIRLFHKFKANLVMAKLKRKDLNVKKNHSLEVTISNTHTHTHTVIS